MSSETRATLRRQHDYAYSEPALHSEEQRAAPVAPPRVDENNYIFNGAPGHTLPDPVYAQYEDTLVAAEGGPRYASADGPAIYTQYEDTLRANPQEDGERYSLPVPPSADWGGAYETRS